MKPDNRMKPIDSLLLVIDIGNTQVVVGIFDQSKLVAQWRIMSAIERTEDETWLLLRSLCEDQKINCDQITGVAISSVKPDVTPSFQQMATKYLNINPVVVTANLNLGIKIMYDNPASVGADRICNAIAGFSRYGGPLIVLDFGTATTFDVVSETGDYLGGIIAPGIQMTANMLHRMTALLPRVELKFPEKIIATSTETSIQAGLMYGTVEMVDGLIQRIKSNFAREVQTIATGGLAQTIVPQLKSVQQVEPMLTLEGLRIIYERVGVPGDPLNKI